MSSIRFSKVPMGYSPDAGRFGYSQQTGGYNVQSGARFPAHMQSMDTCLQHRWVKLYEPDGKSVYGISHKGGYQQGSWFTDGGGVRRFQMNSFRVNNPIGWCSS